MRRQISSLTLLLAVLLAVSALARGVAGQDSAMGIADHPIVGTWALADGGSASFHSDGTFIGIDPGGQASLGMWQPTGERTADMTFRFRVPAEDGTTGGMGTVRATVEVAQDGVTGSFTSTVELPLPDGGTTGQLGSITLDAQRLVLEPMGDPVGPLPEEILE